MKLMKKALVLLLAFTMMITGSGISVFAAAANDPADGDVVTEASEEAEDAAVEAEEPAEEAPAEKAEEPAKAEGEKSEPAADYPAFEQSAKVDGVTVTVNAEKGTFPKGAKLAVRKATKDEIKKADKLIEEVRDTDRNVAASYTFDISILDKDGNELQPADGKSVQVAFKADEMTEDLLTPEVFHIDESGKKDKAEELEVTEKKDTAIVETDGFSTYQVVFSYESLTYTMEAGTDSVTLDTILHDLNLKASVFNVTVDNASLLNVTYTGSETNVGATGGPATDPADWTVTPGNTEGRTTMKVSLYNRPTYYIVVTIGNSTESPHNIVLRHMDGTELKKVNGVYQARISEMIEVYVTGYTSAELSTFKYVYTAKGSGGSADSAIVFFKGRDGSTVDGNLKENNTTTNVEKTKWISTTGTATRTFTLKSIKVNKPNGDSAASALSNVTIQFTYATTNLQSDLNDAERALHPLVLYVGGDEKEITEELGKAGIAHIYGCKKSSTVPTPAKAIPDESTFQGKVAKGDTAVPADSNKYYIKGIAPTGSSPVRITINVNKNDCAYHKGQSGTIHVDAYVLNNVEANTNPDNNNEIIIENTNPVCTYEVYKDGVLFATYTYDQLASINNTVALDGKGDYTVKEIVTEIDFISSEDSAPKTVNINGEESYEITFTDLDDSTKPVIKKGGSDIGSTAPVVGDTLTASTGATDCTFEWFYADENGEPTGEAIGSGESYEVKADDSGKKIVVVATQAKDSSGADLNPARTQASDATAKVEKKENTSAAPAAPTVESKTATSITLSGPTAPEGKTYEYGYKVKGSSGDYDWSDSMTLTDLDPNTEYDIVAREKETEDTKAGPASPTTTEKTAKASQEAPAKPSATATTDTITVTQPDDAGTVTYEYRLDNGEWQTSNVFPNQTPGSEHTVYIRKAGTATADPSPASEGASVTLDKLPGGDAPAAPAATVTTDTITVTEPADAATVAYEYKLDDGEWQTSNVFPGQTPGSEHTVYIRRAETTTTEASVSSEGTPVTLDKLDGGDGPAAPTASATTDTITVTEPDDADTVVYEYKLDNGEWQTSNVFPNQTPGSEHTVYIRKAATDTTQASASSEGTSVTLEKLPGGDGPAAPAATATTDTITVTEPDDAATVAYEYKLDNGEWQTSNVFPEQTPGSEHTVYIRKAETATAQASASSAGTPVTLQKESQEAPASGSLSATAGTDTVTVATESSKKGQEYIILPKGQTPSDSDWESAVRPASDGAEVKFTDLDDGTEYTVFTRKHKTDTQNPSDAISVNVTTKTDAPDEDSIKTTATTLTIEDPEDSTLYTVTDENDNVIAKVKVDADGTITVVQKADGVTVDSSTGDIVVGGLQMEKDYTVTATKLDADGDPIDGAESDPVTVKTKAHDHSWTYSFTDGSPKLKATCNGEGTCEIGSIEMEIKTGKAKYTYGESLAITVDNKDDFVEATDATVGAIEYYDASGNKLDAAPTDVGSYTAKVKVMAAGVAVYPEVGFEIEKLQETAPDESLTPVIDKAGYDKVKVTNPENGYTYEIKDKDGTVVGTATVKSDGTVEASPAGCAAMENGELVFSGLQPNNKYTVEMYKKASDTNHSDSTRLTSNEVTTDKQPEQTPAAPTAAAKSKDTAEITGANTGNKYVFKAGEGESAEEIVITFDASGNPVAPSGITATIDESGKLTVSGLTPNTEYKVTAFKEPTDGNHCESAESEAATIKTAKAAPTTPAQKDLVGAAGNDGSIDGVDSSMEYKDPETGNWVAISGSEITGLKPGNYDIRYKADGDQPASEAKTVTVASKGTDGVPVDANDIDYTTETQKITVTAPVTSTEDPTVYEYSLDGIHWQTTTEFTKVYQVGVENDLQPGTTYQLYVRKAETDTQMATDPAIVSVTTKPAAPDDTKIETTATTLTIHDPENSTKYEVKDGDNVIATVKIGADGSVIGTPSAVSPATVTINEDGDIVVGGLEQEKKYTVVATKIDNNGNDISDPSEGTKKETAAHEHSWKYEVVNGNKFTATCEGEGTCDHQAGGSKPLSVELVAEGKTFDNTPYEASVQKKNGIESIDGCIDYVGSIEYYEGEYSSDKVPLTGAPTNKGDYTAVVNVHVLKNGVDTTYLLTKSYSITKNGENAFPKDDEGHTVAPTISDWTYGGTPSQPTCPAPTHGTVKYVYSDSATGTFTETVPTNAGTWYVKAIVEDSDDYNACESGVTEFKIDPKPIDVSDLEWTGGALTYTGSPLTVSATVKSAALVGDDAVTVSVECTAQTSTGEYTAKATGLSNANYVLTDAAKEDHDWSIVKATDNGFEEGAKPSIEGWTYGGQAATPTGPAAKYGNNTIRYEYCKANASGEPDGNYSTTVPTDAGAYFVRAVIDNTDDYNGAVSDAQAFTIAKKKVTLTWPADPTYDGSEKNVTPAVTGLVAGDEGKVSPVMDGDYKATNRKTSGQYTAKVTGLTGDKAANYEIDSTAEKTHEWNLNKGPVEAPTGVSTKPDSKVEGVDNGSIVGLDTTKPMEYRAKKADGTWGDWTAVPSGANKVEGLKDGDYQVRYAETDNTLPSDPVDVTVAQKGDQTAPTDEPTVPSTGVTTTSITVDPTQPGYEYIVVPKGTDPSDYDWTDSKKSTSGEAITFTKDADGNNLVPGTDYEVICRKAETEDSDASEPGPAKEVTTTPNPPADTKISATPTRLTIKDPEENTQYKVYDEDGNVVATVNVDKDGNVVEPIPDNVQVKENGDIVVEGLEPEKEYTVTATKIEVDEDGNVETKSNESAKSEPKETPALIPEDTPDEPEVGANSDGTATVELPKDGDKNVGMKYVITDEDGNETVIEVKEDGTVVNPTGGITGTIDEDGNLVISGLDPDSVYEVQAVKTPTDADNKDSAPSDPVKIKTAKSAPTSPAMKDKVGEKGNDGSIKGVDETMEYYDPESKKWKPVTGETIENLKPGDYKVRYAAVPASGDTPAQPASEPKTVTVEKKSSDVAPITPDEKDNIKTDSTTTTVSVVDPDPTYEYSIDGGKTWIRPNADGDDVTFDKDADGNPLKPATAYPIKVRKQETADEMPSEAVEISVNTRPEKPNKDDTSKTSNSITIDPTEKGVEYIVVPKGKSPLTEDDWANSQTSQDGEPITFDGLDPGTEYEIVARTPAVTDDDGNVVTPASGESERTPVFTQSETPKEEGKNARNISVNGEPDQEYSLDGGKTWIKPVEGETVETEDGVKVTMQDGKVTFSGLKPSTDYSIITRKDGNDETISDPLEVTTDRTGKYIPETKVNSNVPHATVKGLDAALAEALCTEDERERVLDGEDAYLILEMTNIDKTIAAAEKKIAKAFAEKIQNGTVVAEYIDISVYTKVGDSERTQIHEVGKVLNFTLEIPEKLRNKDKNVKRTFYLIRIHNGKASLVDETTGTKFKFGSSEFSTYVIAYHDQKVGDGNGKKPKTGDDTGITGWLAVMTAAGAALVEIARRRRKAEEEE